MVKRREHTARGVEACDVIVGVLGAGAGGQ